jgi:hypothetical protein
LTRSVRTGSWASRTGHTIRWSSDVAIQAPSQKQGRVGELGFVVVSDQSWSITRYIRLGHCRNPLDDQSHGGWWGLGCCTIRVVRRPVGMVLRMTQKCRHGIMRQAMKET